MTDGIGKVCGIRDIGAIGVEHKTPHAGPAGVDAGRIPYVGKGRTAGARRPPRTRRHVRDRIRIRAPSYTAIAGLDGSFRSRIAKLAGPGVGQP